jgi:hypothetical protein
MRPLAVFAPPLKNPKCNPKCTGYLTQHIHYSCDFNNCLSWHCIFRNFSYNKYNQPRIFSNFLNYWQSICLFFKAKKLYISYQRMAFIMLDFPTPESPVTLIFISTSFHYWSFDLKNSPIPDTPAMFFNVFWHASSGVFSVRMSFTYTYLRVSRP